MSAFPTTAPSDSRQGRLKRKIDELEEVASTPQLKATGNTQLFETMGKGKSKRIKLSARGVLATLSTRRISVTNIKFLENGHRNDGTFADVAIAEFARTTRNGQGERLAVKKLRFVLDSDMTEEKFFRLFVNELRLLDKLSHPNIVKILGFVEDIECRIAWLVFTWEDNGNLREFLRSGEWEIPERVSLVQDVAHGLEYLHTRQPPICHGDLKSLNILVNSSHRAVITDFGSARVIREAQAARATSPSHPVALPNPAAEESYERPKFNVTVSNTAFTLTGPAWSFRWAPPEVLKGRPPDRASDVWALGWIAWEAITDCYPFEDVASEPNVVMKVTEGVLPSIYKHHQLSQIHMLCGFMQDCWGLDPRERPSATECSKTIGWIPQTIPAIKRGEQFAPRSAALLLKIGEIHRLQNRWGDASEAFERGLAIARSTGDREALAQLLHRMGLLFGVQSKNVEAEACYNECLALSTSLGSQIIQAHALRGLGDVHTARYKYTEAESYYAVALAIFESVGEDSGRADALFALGRIQRARNKLKEAETIFTEALSIYESIGDDLDRANAWNRLGDVQRDQSKYTEAELFHAKALTIYKSIGNDSGLAHALRGLGDVRRIQSKYIEAESSYAEALVIFNRIGDTFSRGHALRGIGEVQQAQSRYIEAESSYAEALATYTSSGSDWGRANALLGLGDARRALSKYIEAELSYAEAAAVYQTIGYDSARAHALKWLGDVQRARSKYIEAESSYTEALAIFRSIGDNQGRVNSSLGLADVQLHLARDAQAKASVDDAAPVTERLDNA